MNKKTIFVFAITMSLVGINKLNAQANANKNLSNLTAPTAVNAALIPDKNNIRNLGSVVKAWKNLYLDTAIYIDSIRFISFTSYDNTAIGKDAFHAGGYAPGNTAVGNKCLYHTNTGSGNTGIGSFALYKNSNGIYNTASGFYALYSNTYGSDNTANGMQALYANVTGNYNTASGEGALSSNKSGSYNTAAGYNALVLNTSGNENTAAGYEALFVNKTGDDNTADGYKALYFLESGTGYCTATGSEAGYENTTGTKNSYFGYHAGNTVTTGSSNTIIGYGADISSGSYTNATALGNLAVANGSNRIRIGNGSVTSIGGAVGWTNFSDERIKTNIKQNVPGLAFINLLKPVTYNFDLSKEDQIFKRKDSIEWKEKYDIQKIKFTGFLAQQVEGAAKKINYDFSGVDVPSNDKDVYGLRYSDFVVPLVKAVQELSKMNSIKDSIIQIQNNKINNLENRLEKIETFINLHQSIAGSQQPIVVASASLQQNIPNPFSNSTTINYSVPEQFSSAKIIITEKNGKALKQINISNNKGFVNVDAAMLLSGAYQYSLYVDGKLIDTKQMILSK